MPEDVNTELGLEENIEGALCYILGWISGILFLLLEKDNKFVKFHALQSTITFLGLTILAWILGFFISLISLLLPFGFIFGGITWLIGIIGFILWIVLMLKAYQGEKYKLPVVGDIAEEHV